jgi:hypothetical protein
MFGYQMSETDTPHPGPPKDSFKVELINDPRRFGRALLPSLPDRRPIMAVSLGTNVKTFSLPHPDPTHEASMMLGYAKRFGNETPTPKDHVLAELRAFVKMILPKLLDPLDMTADLTVRQWLETTHYTRKRKEELMRVYERVYGREEDERNFKVNGFIKDEHYAEYKYPRMINARSDAAKVIFGPYFKAIEKELFKLKYFIKKIPKPDRPKWLFEFLHAFGMDYTATDYVSYESHFVPMIMEAIERPLYDYMTKNLSNHLAFMMMYDKYIMGTNSIIFSLFKVKVKGTRMSGEMNTSLGNSFANLIMYLFVAHKSGYKWEDFNVAIEGDDGLAQTDPSKPLNFEIFLDAGFTIKKEVFINLNHASFCGNVFDVEDLNQVTDVRETLVSFGWSKAIYRNSNKKTLAQLLRSKALSLIYEYPGCPILKTLGAKFYELTNGIRAKFTLTNEYLREQIDSMTSYINVHMQELLDKPIGIRTRFLVEELYNVPYNYQLFIEKYISGLTKIQELNYTLIDDVLNPLWAHNDAMYTRYTLQPNDTYFRWESTLIHPFDYQNKNYFTETLVKYKALRKG